MKELTNPLDMLDRQDRDTLAQRFKIALRRARNEGAAIFVLSAICLLATALLWREYEIRSEAFVKLVPKGISNIFLRQQEPRDNVDYPGIVAIVLSPKAATDPAEICNQGQSEQCRIGKLMLTATELLFRIADEPTQAGAEDDASECGKSVSQVLADRLLDVLKGWRLNQNASERCAWIRRAARLVEHAQPFSENMQPPDFIVPSCAPLAASKGPIGVGVAGCLPGVSQHIATLIPAQLSKLRGNESYNVKTAGEADGKSDETKAAELRFKDYATPVQRAIKIGELLDLSVELTELALQTSKEKSESGTDVRIVQAYFISPDNVLHIWAPGIIEPLATFPRERQWSAASYFRTFVQFGGTLPYYSKPYLDFGGYGVVRTECHPLNRATKNNPRAQGELVGIVCVDFAIPMLTNPAIIQEWSRQPFLHVGVVRVRSRGGIEVESAQFIDSPSKNSKSVALQTAVQDLVARGSIDKLTQSPQQMTLDGHSGFLVPIEETDDGRVSFLAAFPRDPRELDTSPGLLWCTVCAGTLWLFFTVGNGIGAYRDRQTRTRIALFRSLQAGVIETSGAEHLIIRANDRAEELLRRKLPKELTNSEGKWHLQRWNRSSEAVGTSSESDGESTYRFWDLVDFAFRLKKDRLYGTDSEGIDSDGADPSDYEQLAQQVITNDRTAGVTTRYWIALVGSEALNVAAASARPAREWLQVVAGPYIPMDGWEGTGDDAGPKLMSYGFIQPAGELRSKQLDAACEQAIERQEQIRAPRV